MNRVWARATASSRRTTRALACGLGAVLLVGATYPARNDGAVTSLSIVPTSSQAQITIGIEGAVQIRDFALSNPDRIVVDITGATLGFQREVAYLHRAFNADRDLRIRDFALSNPDRIVVDITGATLGFRKPGYDRIERGGVIDVRYAQNQSDVVRIVLTLTG